MENQVKIFIGVIVLLVMGTIVTVFLRSNPAPEGPGKLDQFAMCLTAKGATFYGAFWCPHCQAQKKLFGSSAKLLPYVECSTADGKAQTQICIDKKITGYPTWEFADGSRPFSGEATLEQLSSQTGCPLPVGEGTPALETEGQSSDANVSE